MANPGDIRAGGAVIEFRADKSKLEKDLVSGGDILGSLKRTLGGRSDLKDIIEIGRGAGPIAGASLLARSVGDIFKTMADINDELKKTDSSVTGIFNTVASRIPILGDLYTSVQDAVDRLSGDAADRQRLQQWAERDLALAKQRRKAMADLREEVARGKNTQRQFDASFNRERMSPREQEIQKIIDDATDELIQVDLRYDDIRNRTAPENRERVDRERLKEIQAIESRTDKRLELIRKRRREEDAEERRQGVLAAGGGTMFNAAIEGIKRGVVETIETRRRADDELSRHTAEVLRKLSDASTVMSSVYSTGIGTNPAALRTTAMEFASPRAQEMDVHRIREIIDRLWSRAESGQGGLVIQ